MTAARRHFETALSDVNNLMFFHEQVGGAAPGRRAIGLSSLNKSGVVLLCAAWETYVENVVHEAATKSVKLARTPNDLPKSIQRLVTTHVRTGKDEAAWRSLAGRGWKDVAISAVGEKVRGLNTPKPGPVRELFKAALGVDDITDDWAWAKNNNGKVIDRMTEFVTMRGAIAHGEILPHTVKKSHLRYQIDLIERVIPFIERRVLRWRLSLRDAQKNK